MTVADVSFDAPLSHPFSYRVPDGWTLAPGQRVVAPLGRANRTGVIVALHERDDAAGLKPLLRLADSARVLDADGLALARWIAEQSLSSLGSTLAALLPPSAATNQQATPAPIQQSAATNHPEQATHASSRSHAPIHESEGEIGLKRGWPILEGSRLRSSDQDVSRLQSVPKPELLVGAGRETRLLERIGEGPALVIVPDVEAAARWAQRLGRRGPVVRLDSGVDDAERVAAWAALRAGAASRAVGTRSALLAPLPRGATVALVDEHEAAHKPPGAPRLHSREIVLERAAREGQRALLTAGTPSVEMWWRADSARAVLEVAAPGAWPITQVADTRGILRREPLTPTLSRAMRETLNAGRPVLLLVSRLASALACDECGDILRCPECVIALAYVRAARTLSCRVCGRVVTLPETCPACRGRRLSPFGWGAERVEHAVRRRFPEARVARYDPEATRGARAEAQRRAAAEAQVVIGTRGALRLFGPGALGLAGFVAPDQLLRLPDFRAGERLFSLIWGAAERVARGGALVLQSQSPEHYVVDAALRQDLGAFYRHELKFRGELGYPPFRRLAVVTVSAKAPADLRRLADEVAAALGADRELVVYPPSADRRDRLRRIVVKGRDDLPARLAAGLPDSGRPPSRSRGTISVEVDPVEWTF